jgi:hypothetical protein
LNGGDILTYFLYGGIEFALTTASNEDIGTFGSEPFCGSEANAAVATGDNSDLA